MSTRGVCGILSAVFEHGHGVLGVCQAPNKTTANTLHR